MTTGVVTPGKETRGIESSGRAAATLAITWKDAVAAHRDELHVGNVSLCREADLLPKDIANRLPDMGEGDSTGAQADAGELTGAWSPSRLLTVPENRFDRNHLRGLQLEPRVGRFYPLGLFKDARDMVCEETRPARITAMTDKHISVDFNHPLARYPIGMELNIDGVLEKDDQQFEHEADPLHKLLQDPGIAAPLASNESTDFGDRDAGMSRSDETEDEIFYRMPRLVQHLDDRALKTISSLYAEILPAGAEVLDLMGSHNSHLEAAAPESLTVLGMNSIELEVNHQADRQLVHDLNASPATDLGPETFDAVVCTASIEYLVDPLAVIAEVRRILRSGGVFAVAFSNRWFPTKAIRIWSELHEFERLGMVTQWLHSVGFTGLNTLSSRGWPRPANDIYAHRITLSDPVYAVSGYKPSN